MPFPERWRRLLATRVPLFSSLSPAERLRFEDLVKLFKAGKTWEGPGGSELDDDVAVTVAGHAVVLVLGLDLTWFRNVTSIIVHPSTVVRRGERSLGGGVVTESPAHLHGEEHLHGPVMLTWDAVLAATQAPVTGRNVVHHELAHKLDMLDGFVDGVPPVGGRQATRRFAEVTAELYQAIIDGAHTVLDPYAATNRAEFFAVSTEAFFARPGLLEAAHPVLYEALRGFYRWDPVGTSRTG